MAAKTGKKVSSTDSLIALAPSASKAFVSSIPIDVLLLEGAKAAAAGKALRAKLARLPSFDIKHLDNLPALLAGLKAAEAAWGNSRFASKAGRNKVAARKEAEALRSDLLASADFLFRNDAAASAELARIRDGEGVADLVADLTDLAEFWASHKKVWAVDEELSDADFKRATELADILGSEDDPEASVTAMERRNQLAFLVETSLRELRAAAAFLLRKSPARLAPFLSRYAALKQAKHRRKAKAASETPA